MHQGEWNLKNLDMPELVKNGHWDGCQCSEENDGGEPAATSLDVGADDSEEMDKD